MGYRVLEVMKLTPWNVVCWVYPKITSFHEGIDSVDQQAFNVIFDRSITIAITAISSQIVLKTTWITIMNMQIILQFDSTIKQDVELHQCTTHIIQFIYQVSVPSVNLIHPIAYGTYSMPALCRGILIVYLLCHCFNNSVAGYQVTECQLVILFPPRPLLYYCCNNSAYRSLVLIINNKYSSCNAN